MIKFDEKLLNDKFIVSFCQNCQKFVWPPSSQCSVCHNITVWKESSRNGKILEFSKKGNCYFCLIETFDSIRVLGSIESSMIPKIDQRVVLTKYSYDQNPKFIFKLV